MNANPTNKPPTPRLLASGSPLLDPGQWTHGTQWCRAGVDLLADQETPDTQSCAVSDPSDITDQTPADTQRGHVGDVMNANPTIPGATPSRAASGSPLLDPGHGVHGSISTQKTSAGVDLLADGQVAPDTQMIHAVSDPSDITDQSAADTQTGHVGDVTSCDPTIGSSTAIGHTSGRTSSSQPPTIERTTPRPAPPDDGWLELRIWAEMFHDAQKTRIANVNRAERGGVDPEIYAAHIGVLERTEHDCRLALRRCLRRVAPPSIIHWQKQTNGIGVDLLARLLGHLGHPRWATPHHWEGTGSNRVLITDPPFERTVGQLWQYCGHGAPGRRVKGMSVDDIGSLGSPTLKMLVHLNAEACMKCRTSPFRLVYENVRLDVADKTHSVECARCGPSGKPAQPGSPWSPGHQNAHALRVTGKEILRDLWKVAP